MINFIQAGDSITLTAPYDVASGEGALVEAVFGVAYSDTLSGESGEFAVTKVYSLKKKTTDAPAQGGAAYWNDTAKEVTVTASGNTKIGAFILAAANGDTEATVRLNGAV